MTASIGLTVAPDRLQLPPGAEAEITLLVVNEGPLVDEFGVQVEGIDPGWIAIRTPTVSLFPGASGTMELSLRLPTGTAALAGLYRVVFTVTSRTDPAEATRGELLLELISIGAVGLDVAPKQVRTRGAGNFRALLTNPSNSEQIVDLRVTDPEEGLEAVLDLDRVALAAGSATEVPFSLKPHRRPLMGSEHTYTFTLSVYPADLEMAEPLASATGYLIYHAPLPWIALVLPRLRRYLFPLAALLLLLAVAAWLLSDPGERDFALLEAEATATAAAALTPVGIANVAPVGAPTVDPAAQPSVQVPAEAATADAAAGEAGANAGEDGGAAGAEAGGAGEAPSALGGAGLPTIAMFELRVPRDGPRGEFELAWEVTDASEVMVDGEPQPPAAAVRVQATEDRQFDLVASNDVGSVTKSIGIVILRPPEIVEFRADPENVTPGQSTTLIWETRRGDVASLNQQVVSPERGQREVRPDRDTVFTLIVENDLGREERSVLVRVTAPAS